MPKQMFVSDLSEKYELQYVSDSQDVAAIIEHLGDKLAGSRNEFDSFFVSIADGDYIEVWGMSGTVPYNSKRVYRII